MKKASRRSKPVYHAGVRVVTGFVFGLVLAVGQLAFSNTQPIVALQTWGEDLGQRIFANVFTAPSSSYFITDTPFVFVDLDREACLAFETMSNAILNCSVPGSPPPEYLGAVLRAVSATAPKVIILDYNIPALFMEDLDRSAPGLAAAIDADGPPIIVPAPLAPTLNPARSIATAPLSLISNKTRGRVRPAAMLTWTDERVNDATIRGYPSVVSVSSPDRAGEFQYLASAPFLAAVISQSGLKKADRLLYRADNGEPCSVASGTVISKYQPSLLELCEQSIFLRPEAIAVQRLIFSIQSLADISARQELGFEQVADEFTIARYRGAGTARGGMLYRHVTARALVAAVPGQPFAALRDNIAMKDTIVVIGTSATEANDWQRTPLGRMAGAEVIINATRAFQDFGPLPANGSAVAQFVQDLFPSATTMILLFFVTWAAFHLESIRRPVSSLLTMSAGVFISIAVAAVFTYSRLFDQQPQNVDFLLPVLAILLETIVDILKRLIDVIERGVETAIQLSGRLLSRRLRNGG